MYTIEAHRCAECQELFANYLSDDGEPDVDIDWIDGRWICWSCWHIEAHTHYMWDEAGLPHRAILPKDFGFIYS